MDAQRSYAILLTVLAACTPGSPGVNEGAKVKGDETATGTTEATGRDEPCPTTQTVCACDSAVVTFQEIADQLATPTAEGSIDGSGSQIWAVFDLGGATVEEALCNGDNPVVVEGGGGPLMADTVLELDLTGYDGYGFSLIAFDHTLQFLGFAAAAISSATPGVEIATEPYSGPDAGTTRE